LSTTQFPTLISSNWKMTRTPQWNTNVQTSSTRNRTRAPLQAKPLWKWTLKTGILQSAPAIADLQAITNLYNAMQGRGDFFLWTDPEGDSIVDPSVQINISGTYYWPVAFTADAVDFDRFAYQLWECGTLEFEQVGFPSATFVNLQQPHGAITSATLNILTSHTLGAPSTSIGAICSVDGLSLFSRGWLNGSGAWTLRTDTHVMAIPFLASSVTVIFTINTAGAPITLTTPEDFLIYDCWLDVSYADLTGATLRATSAVVAVTIITDDGTAVNPGNVIDGDPTTFALIERTHLNTIDFAPAIVLTNFV
jgi:Conserved hypothetical protein 2217 (DUF2460)